ncbi:MAG: cytochrome c [Pseudomonadota bacterium]
MRFFLSLIAAVGLATGITAAATAQNLDVIKERKAQFKQYLDFVKPGTAMVRGQAAFDLEKAKAFYAGIAENSTKFKGLFPDDSKTGGKTEALPVIWEKKDDFLGRFDKLASDASAAVESTTDEASFKGNWGKVLGNCGACHKVYRVEK